MWDREVSHFMRFGFTDRPTSLGRHPIMEEATGRDPESVYADHTP